MLNRWLLSLCLLPLATAAGQLQLVGEARLKVLLLPVYESRLYSADGRYREGQRPLHLEIRYLIPVRSNALVARTGDEWRQQGRTHPAQEAWLQQLAGIWPDVARGDELTLQLDAEGASTFYLNGSALGGIDDTAFGEHFLGIWLAPDTSRPEMRRQLIGGES